MNNEDKEILSKVKSNFGSYESISLANDDVERLLIIIRHIQKQADEALKEKPLGAEMADVFDKIIEPKEDKKKNRDCYKQD